MKVKNLDSIPIQCHLLLKSENSFEILSCHTFHYDLLCNYIIDETAQKCYESTFVLKRQFIL